MKLIRIVFVIICLLLINVSGQTQEKIPWPSLEDSPWPTWRGDAQATGRSEFVGPATSNIKWIRDMPLGIVHGPVIGNDDVLYFGSAAVFPDSNYFYAVNSDGTDLWNFRTELTYPNEGAGLIGSDGTIYFPSNNSFLYAVDKNGKQKWKIGLLSIGDNSSLAIAKNGDLYVSTEADSLIIIDTQLGEIKYKKYLGAGLNAGQVTFSADGTRIIYTLSQSGSPDVTPYLVCADLLGNEIWSRQFRALIEAMPTVDNEDNIYVTGYDETVTDQAALFSFDRNGNLNWYFGNYQIFYDGAPTIDSNGNIIFIGGDYLDSGEFRFQVYSLDYYGNLNWKHVIDPALITLDTWIDHPLVCDADGKIYFGSRDGIYFYCLNSDGELLWKLDLEGNKFFSSPAIGSDGTLYIGTSVFSLFQNHTRSLIAIKDKPNSLEDEETPTEFMLEQNYPNPFNPTTSIKYRVASSEKVSLKVFDMLGREVATFVNETKPVGTYEVEFDGSKLTSGVYFCVLQSRNVRISKKMLLVK